MIGLKMSESFYPAVIVSALSPCHPERSKNAHECGRFAESKDPYPA